MNSMSFSMSPMQGASSISSQKPPPPPPPSGEDLISQLDSDDTSSLSLDELEDSELGDRLTSQFDDIDTDGDGLLSVAELDVGAQSTSGPPGPGGPPPSGSAQESITSGADTEALFQSLFEALDAEETVASSDMSAYAQQMYTDMQALLGRAA